ncbi:MAG TPA: hypothetical protein VF540_00870 [Segetibacter sp.]
MKKLIFRSCICAFCLTVATSCSKSVKTPSARPTTAAKTTSTGTATTSTGTATTTTTENQDQNSHTCGSQSTSSGGQTGY